MDQISIKQEKTQDNRCRVCLQQTESTTSLQNITSFEQAVITYWDILLLISDIETENCVDAPQKICEACAERAVVSFDFKLSCENSDKILQSEFNLNKIILNDLKVEVTEEKIVNISDIENATFKSDFNCIDDDDDEYDNSKKEPEFFSTDIKNILNGDATILEGSNDSTKIVNDGESDNSLLNYSISKHSCKRCGMMFIRKCNLTKHELTNKCKERIFPRKCRNCDYKPTSQLDYNEHRVSVHALQNTKRSCMHCDFTYANYSDYKQHLYAFHLDKKTSCEFCENIYFTLGSLRVHMRNEHPDDSFMPNSSEKDVKLTPTRNYFACQFCDYTSPNVIKLNVHMTECHEDKMIVQCTLCEKRFFTKKSLEFHVRWNHTTIVMCDVCGKTCKNRQALTEHKYTHSEIKKYECKECNKKYSHRSGLRKHMFQHNDVEYVCEECGMAFKCIQNLNNHIQCLHEKVKRYACHLCPKMYFNLGSLKKHVKSIHLSVKKHECGVCGKLFLNKIELTKHKLVHTEEKRNLRKKAARHKDSKII